MSMIDVSAWGWPQWVVVSMSIWWVLHVTANNGKPQGDFNITITLIGVTVSYFIYISGGFFR